MSAPMIFIPASSRSASSSLAQDVNEASANVIVAQMLFLQASDPKKDIFFYINSPGGSVYDALAIYDTMQFLTCDVQTVGIGVQASAAAFLLSSGAKGKRQVLPNATVMIHQPSSGTRGKVTDQEIDLKESLRIKHLLKASWPRTPARSRKRSIGRSPK
jgi:ATP-dependent Clp protease protease subunit